MTNTTHENNMQLESEKVIVSAPMSFTGSAQRLWRMQDGSEGAAHVGMVIMAIACIVLAWSVIICWYGMFGLMLVPYRLLRRGSRKRTRQALQHRELLNELGRGSGTQEATRSPRT